MTFRHTITLADITAYPVRAAGGVSPKMALGTMPTRPALLVRIEDTSGCFGWGEIWANFPPRANQHKAHLVEDVIAPPLTNFSFTDPREVGDALRQKLSTYFLHVGQSNVFEHVLAGLDTALWDLALRHAGVSFATFMDLRDVGAKAYATSINAEDLDRLIPHHAALGQTYFKLKTGFAAHETSDIIARGAALCPEHCRIMIDSNQAWTLEQAITSLRAVEGYDVYFSEEPLRADAPLAEWEALATATSIPLAGGENLYGIEHFATMTRAGLHVIQPDVAKWGGVSGALDLAAALPEHPLWPHFMGTAVGQQAALAISAALGEDSCCEIDVNDNALRTDLCGDVIQVRDGRVTLSQEPGLLRPPEPEWLETFADTND